MVKNDLEDKNINNLSTDDIFKFMDLYFNRKFVMYTHLYNSMNKFFDEDVRQFLENGDHTFFEKITKNKVIKYKFKYDNIRIKEPTLDNDIEPMFPSDARNRNLTYSSKLIARVTQIQEIIDIATDEKEIKIIGQPEDNIPIANLPTMVRSKYCSLNLYKGYDKSECEYDPGGYFIVNGSEKVVISQDRMVENKPLVFLKKDSGTELYTVQVNSKSYKPHGITQIISIKIKKDGNITIRVPILNEVNIFVLFRALGIEPDREIINYICSDEKDYEMIDKIRSGLSFSKTDKENIKILTQEQAIEYLSAKLRVLKKYIEGDKNIKTNQKRTHILTLLQNNFLPHIEGSLVNKAYYIGYMINKLLRASLGRISIDDRDSYINKRVDLPGDLLMELFRQFYRQMLNNCGNFFKKRTGGDDTPLNIINQIKPNTIEQGIKASLLTGAWPRRKGVAQMMQRLTYLQAISFLRRVDAPGGDASTSKLTSPRHLHQSSVSLLDCVQTPEHAKVGLTKHLALIASISILEQSQLGIIKNFLKKKIIDLRDINPTKIKNMTKVFINGEWIGVVNDAIKLDDELRKNKENGVFNPLISIVWDIPEKEIKIYCDGGRIYRPVLKVNDNKIKLTKDLINKISLNKSDKSKGLITSWEEFLMENPGIVEYIDMEEQPYLLFCDKIENLEKMRHTMINSIEYAKNEEANTNDLQNRYDDKYLYKKYSHCEFHPCFLIGEIVSNIPFCNHNAGPRNIFYYAQAKQGMGLYTSNYRDRLDISYILYNPQKALITTRASKYNNTDIMASGENIVVAISTYTGFNQEDSIVFNLSSIERGLFRSTSLKKEFAQIQKNQSTSQDDIFMKPNPSKVTGMKHGSYDKLNEKGYVPEETTIVDGDIIIGKVSPIQPVGNSNKVFKDSSIVYKSYTPGVIDKVYTNIYNSEGYEMRKVRIRSERVPRIGDKFCSRYGQKGTIGLYLRQSDMPFTKHGITPDIILNPHCFVGETQVSLPNGITKRIDRFSNQGLEKVLSYNKNIYDENDNLINNNGNIESYSIGMENKGIKDTIKLILEDGKELICTPDHKFPIKTNDKIIIKEAKDLNENDILLASFDGTEDKNYNDEKEWSLETKYFNFNMKDSIQREKALAFSRIVGYILADGTVSKDKRDDVSFNVRMCLGCKIDLDNMVDDIKLITDTKQLIYKDELTYIVQLDTKLGQSIANLEGMVHGRRTIQETKLPSYILQDNCPKSIIREFLAGLFGGDGHAPYLQKNTFSTVGFSQSICEEFKQSNIEKMNNICRLLEKLNVNANITRTRECINNCESYKEHPRCQTELEVVSNLDYLNNVGFRYCIQKLARLSIASSYERLCNNVAKQHNEIIKLINDKIDNGKNINQSIEEGRKEYYTDKLPLNEYYSNVTNNIVNNRRRIDRAQSVLHFNYKFFPTAEKYLENINCLNWFVRDNGKINYIVKKDDTLIPTFNMKVKGIVKHKPIEVFDIGVATYHNFMANGIITRNCIPSRMTIGQIIECVMGKSCAINGTEGDGTPFNGVDIDSIRNELKKLGYSDSGKEYLYNGMTGQKMKTEIFIGPTYYHRLKHLVEDKFHARARGPKTLLMHQPPEGRSREGGLRLGEMERDSLLAHGVSRFLKEKLLDTSDAYSTYICDLCGLFAQRLFKKDNQSHSSANDLHYCAACKNYTKISKVMIPYAFKLVLQEMMAMNIAPRIRVQQDPISI